MISADKVPLIVNSQTLSEYSPGEKFERCISALCDRHNLVDHYTVTRRILKVSSAIISGLAKVPFIPVSMKLGPVLGPISAFNNVAGFFILEYWAVSKTINDFLSPKTQAQIELNKKGKLRTRDVCRNVAIISTASMFALSSQILVALAGVYYSEEKFKVPVGIVLLVGGALIPIRSLQLSIERLSLSCQKSIQAEITEIKTKIANLLLANQRMFIQKPRQRKIQLIKKCDKIRSLEGASSAKIKGYVSALFQNLDSFISPTHKTIGKCFKYTGLVTGTLLAGAFEYILGDYTFHITKTEIINNDFIAGILSTLAVTSTAYLFATSIIKTTQRVFNTFGNAIIGTEIRNLGWQLRPKISFALTAVGLLIDIFAMGPNFVIFRDFYKDNEVEREAFIGVICVSYFLILFTSTLDIINDVVTHSIAKGSKEEQQILSLSLEFQKLADLINKSPSREFIEYLMAIEEPTKTSLLTRINVSNQQLALMANQLDFVQVPNGNEAKSEVVVIKLDEKNTEI